MPVTAISVSHFRGAVQPFILGVIVLFGSSPLLAAEQSSPCPAKRAEIERGISAAEAHGNVREVRGLKKALRAANNHCTTHCSRLSAIERLPRHRRRSKRQAELKNAERKGGSQKIAKQRTKLEEARRKLSEAQQPLPH
jgi:Protein of unknown function (DUF1090)